MAKMQRTYEETCSMMPNQAEGTIDGNPYYFRARHGYWTIAIVKPGHDPVCEGPALREGALLFYKSGEDGRAGWYEEFESIVHKLLDEFEAGGVGEVKEMRPFEQLSKEELEAYFKNVMDDIFNHTPEKYIKDIQKRQSEKN